MNSDVQSYFHIIILFFVIGPGWILWQLCFKIETEEHKTIKWQIKWHISILLIIFNNKTSIIVNTTVVHIKTFLLQSPKAVQSWNSICLRRLNYFSINYISIFSHWSYNKKKAHELSPVPFLRIFQSGDTVTFYPSLLFLDCSKNPHSGKTSITFLSLLITLKEE